MGAELLLGLKPQILHSIWLPPCNSHPQSIRIPSRLLRFIFSFHVETAFLRLWDRAPGCRAVWRPLWDLAVGQSVVENLILPLPAAPALIWEDYSPSLGLENTCHTALELSAHGMVFPPSLWTTWELCPRLTHLGLASAKHALELHNVLWLNGLGSHFLTASPSVDFLLKHIASRN